MMLLSGLSIYSMSLFVLQAFIEMASEEAAITMVNYYTTATPHVRNQPVYIQYSNHRELKTDNLPNQGVRITVTPNTFKYLFPCHSRVNDIQDYITQTLFSDF